MGASSSTRRVTVSNDQRNVIQVKMLSLQKIKLSANFINCYFTKILLKYLENCAWSIKKVEF